MRRLGLLACVLLAAAPPALAGDLVLRRVMLSAGGVGYFEYAADLDGAATIGLDVPLAQVDDVLASLVVFDEAGHVGGLELPGEDASRAAFAELPFGPGALASARDYLNGLQGVELQVSGPRPMTGRLLRAEAVPEPDGTKAPVTRTRVTLLTETGLQQFVLEETESVQVADPALRGRIAGALATLRGQAAHEIRHLALQAPGTARRTVRVGYVAAAPLWKASYRLVLPEAEGRPARLQAWAVLENDTAADWHEVEVTLQYGNPVTFRQALYRSYYVERPLVPVEVLGRILPGVDTRARAVPLTAAAPPPMPAPAAAAKAARMMAAAAIAAPEAEATASEGVAATLFRLPAPLDLPAGHSAAVPILDRAVPAERLGLVQEGRGHPLTALRLRNDTGASLPAGVLTVYDTADAAAFMGDARLGGMPPAESRLLAFAEDLATATDWRTEEGTTVLRVTAAQGVLHIERRDRWTARLTLAAPAGAGRRLLVEIPKRPEGTLAAEAGVVPAEETASAWRFLLDLKPAETRTLVVHVDRITREQTALLDDQGVLAAILGEQALGEPARAALRHLAELRTALAAREAERDRLAARRDEIERDEDRLRKNLAAVPAADALHLRLVQALAADEEQLGALAAQSAQAQQAVQQARAALEQAVLSLRI
jgi:hypothetical protein